MNSQFFDRAIAAISESLIKIKQEIAKDYIAECVKDDELNADLDLSDIIETMDHNDVVYALEKLINELLILKSQEYVINHNELVAESIK